MAVPRSVTDSFRTDDSAAGDAPSAFPSLMRVMAMGRLVLSGSDESVRCGWAEPCRHGSAHAEPCL